MSLVQHSQTLIKMGNLRSFLCRSLYCVSCWVLMPSLVQHSEMLIDMGN